MPLNLNIEVEDNQALPIVRVKGDIDVHTCPQLNEGMTEIIDNGHTSILLDLEGIHYIDSTGLGIIAHTARTLDEKKGSIYVVCNQPQIKKIFTVSGLDKKNIRLFGSEQDALAEVSA